ncbi:MAG: YceI family protein [Thiobacillus sp.]|nr:YceI family protein [Thiobacillus sp.]
MVKPLLFLGVLVASVAAQAQDWKVDYVKSRVSFVVRQMNVPVEGGFKRFIAQVSFDPAKVESAKMRVDLDMASIDTGSAEGDDEARRPLWFDMARHPRATFVSQSVARQADGRYMARGDLVIKGRTRAVSVPFSLGRQANGAWLAEGKLPVSRADFGIGGGDWNDVVANEAEARFRIWLTP